MREPSCDILLTNGESLFRKQDKWIKDGAPDDMFPFTGIVKMFRPKWVLGEQQRAINGIPNGERPVADQFCETLVAPFFVSSCNDSDVSALGDNRATHLVDKFRAIVQTTVPRDDFAGSQHVGLLLVPGFFCGAERAINDVHAIFCIRPTAIRPVSDKGRPDFLNVIRRRRPTVEIPSSELHAHNISPRVSSSDCPLLALC